MATPPLSTCRACQGTVSREATACPHCGAPDPAGAKAAAAADELSRKRWGCGILLGLLVIFGLVGLFADDSTPGAAPTTTPSESVSSAPVSVPMTSPEVVRANLDSASWREAVGNCKHPSRARLRRLAAAHPEWSAEVLGDATCRLITMGMTGEQVVAAWGRPDRINSTQLATSSHEQWVYGDHDLVYLDDGVVTSWQSMRGETP